jgi:hypothetical protein
VKRNPLATDLALAVLAAVLVLIISPGLAVAGLIALLVLTFAVVSAIRKSRKRRARPARRAHRRPPRRTS